MENLNARFKQVGGVYNDLEVAQSGGGGGGGGVKQTKLSPRSNNWKKKYLEIKLENDNLLKEKEILLRKIKKLEKNKQ